MLFGLVRLEVVVTGGAVSTHCGSVLSLAKIFVFLLMVGFSTSRKVFSIAFISFALAFSDN